MGEEHDSWLEGIGVNVSGVLSSVAQTVSDTASGVASTVGSAASSVVSTVGGAVSGAVETVGGAVSSVASSTVDAVGTVVQGAGETVGSAASEVGKVAGQAWQGAKSVAGDVADFGKGVYGQMKEDAAYVKKGEGLVGSGVDWLEAKAKAGTGWVAEKAKGIPVLEQVADAGKAVVDFNVDVSGGALKGATGMVGGVLSAAANPVDTVKGLESMAEHIPGVGTPAKLVHGAYDLAFSDKSASQVANETLNPMEDVKYWDGVGKAVAAPMIKAVKKAVKEGKPGEIVGEVGVIAASMLVGAGEVGVAAKGAVVVEGAVVEGAVVEGAVVEGAAAVEGAAGATAGETVTAAQGAEAGAVAGETGAAAEEAGVVGEAKVPVDSPVPKNAPAGKVKGPPKREPFADDPDFHESIKEMEDVPGANTNEPLPDSSSARTRQQAGVSVAEDHHIATRYLEKNKAIFERAGTHIDSDLNLIKEFPEHGELRGWYDWKNRSYKFNMKGHHPDYNSWVTKTLTDAIPRGLAPDQALERIIEVNKRLETIIRQNPEVLSHGPDILPPAVRNIKL